MPKQIKILLGIVAIALLAVLAINHFSKQQPSPAATKPAQEQAVVTPENKKADETANEKAEAPAKPTEPTEKVTPEAEKPKVVETFKEGVHYRSLKRPVQTDVQKGQIEVAEVFWYGCPHCYNLEPIVERWKPSLSGDAVFVRRPGFFGSNIWQTHAQLYYTVRNMGIEDKVHDGIFNEVQNRRNQLKDANAMADFLNKRYGIDKKEFVGQFNSFGVNHLLQKSYAQLKGYDLTGVPALVIDGRYIVEPGMAGSLNNMPVIADYLIKKIRNERAPKSS